MMHGAWKLTLLLGVLASFGAWAAGETEIKERMDRGELPDPQPTADHSLFDELKQDFKSGPEVTSACLKCHNQAAKQVMQTSHWTWICPRAKAELAARRGDVVGKAEHVINNFCIALGSNEPRCTSCHAGYGWRDETFDFDDETRVDCLVCHDTTGKYKKFPTAAGHPVYEPTEWPKGSGHLWQPPNLGELAQNVGKPTRENCGICHFFGGGGEGIKHGDMDVSLFHPDRDVDVHMDEKGLNFQCTECHTTVNHFVSGRCFTIPAVESREFVMRGLRKNLLACESCHTAEPHKDHPKLDHHTDKVSCQACHLPLMAPKKPTKMWWDWSAAGEKNAQGKPQTKKVKVLPEGMDPADPEAAKAGRDELAYHGMKGEFQWAMAAVPEYVWFNGQVSHTFIGDTIDDATPGRDSGSRHGRYDKIDLNRPVVKINALHGDYHDPKARIFPVKVHRGKQPYDKKTKNLVVPNLFPSKPGNDSAYWKFYDWDKAVAAGMAYLELPYSGELGWIQTEMVWPLSHMIAPKEKALSCDECHARDGRLANLEGFYLPGRDSSALVDWAGLLAVLAALAGVLTHGGLRILFQRKRGAS